MRVLITGSRGQIGSALKKNVPENWEIIATDHNVLDITDVNAVESVVASFQPDAIINTAGFTNVEKAELPENLDRVFDVNATGPMNLAKVCRAQGTRLVHMSTDYVFYGQNSGKYSEVDPPCSVNVYGRSKIAGELLALANNPNTLIVRTSHLFGEGPRNFTRRLIERARSGEELVMDNRGRFNPTYVNDLANKLIDIVQSYPQAKGILHCAGPDSVNALDYANQILELAGMGDVEIKVGKEPNLKAPRPINSALDTSLLNEMGIVFVPLKDSLQTCVRNIIAEADAK